MYGRWLLMAGLLLTGVSCAQRGGSDDEPQPLQRPVVVHVVNNYRLSMEIYALGSGITHRLGLVYPGVPRDFELVKTLINSGAVDFMAQPSGTGPTVRTGEVRFSPGDTLDVMIATNLILSRVLVRM